MSNDKYVSRREFYAWSKLWEAGDRVERRRFLELMEEQRQRQAKENAPKPAPSRRRQEAEGITEEDPKYADHLFLQGHALLGKLDAEEEDIIREHRARRRGPTTKRKAGGNLVSTYSD